MRSLKASEESPKQEPSDATLCAIATSARRGHGEGSIYRDEANGTWVGAISLGWRPDGKRIRRKVTGRTKTEVRDKLRKLQAEAGAGLRTSASYTLAKAVDDWAAEALDGLAPKTLDGKETVYRNGTDDLPSSARNRGSHGLVQDAAVASSWAGEQAREDARGSPRRRPECVRAVAHRTTAPGGDGCVVAQAPGWRAGFCRHS